MAIGWNGNGNHNLKYGIGCNWMELGKTDGKWRTGS